MPATQLFRGKAVDYSLKSINFAIVKSLNRLANELKD